MSYFKVLTQGQTLVVNITENDATSVTTYTDSGLGTSHTLPLTITSDTEFHFAARANYAPHILTVSQLDGTELYSATVEPHPSKPHIIGPEPTAPQVAADVGAREPEFYVLPTGAIASNIPRYGPAFTNQSVLTSGTMQLSAISLPAGTEVSSISYHSATTAAGTPTNQWFALYNSDRTLIGQTTDDTTTAWAANTVKTLSFSSPVTTTKSGLHYVGIMVAAATPPTLFAANIGAYLSLMAPVLSGGSTASLTTTAPATAAALTVSGLVPYAYVS